MNMPLYQGQTNGTPDLRMGNVPGVENTLQTPQTVTSIPGHGITSNHRVNHHYLTRNSGPKASSLDQGQIVFVYKHQTPMRNTLKTHALLNLPMLNYHLYNSGDTYSDPASVLNKWCPQGVIVNEFGGDTSTDRVNIHSKQGRIINCTVAGWCTTMNIWGSIADGDTLYLTLKKVTLLAGTKFVFGIGNSFILQEDTECWQFLAETKPSFEIGEVSIEIGKVFRSKRMSSYNMVNDRMTRDLPMMIKYGQQFECFFNVKRPRIHL
jgi:hypothetical protein